MELGYRIFDSFMIKLCPLPLIQISVMRTSEADLQRVKMLAEMVKTAGKRFVIHPMDVFLSDPHPQIRQENLVMIQRFAEMTDLGLIIHDEIMPDGQVLRDKRSELFQQGVAELEKICPVALENARDSRHALWFWETFSHQITFDIGHFESDKIDSLAIAKGLSSELATRLAFVHLHRSNGPKPNGLIDHWPLTPDCRELKTLRQLLELKPDLKVILELESKEDIEESLEVLQGESFVYDQI